jgi:hypothetical protein
LRRRHLFHALLFLLIPTILLCRWVGISSRILFNQKGAIKMCISQGTAHEHYYFPYITT